VADSLLILGGFWTNLDVHGSDSPYRFIHVIDSCSTVAIETQTK
jgi:hypothetical protein